MAERPPAGSVDEPPRVGKCPAGLAMCRTSRASRRRDALLCPRAEPAGRRPRSPWRARRRPLKSPSTPITSLPIWVVVAGLHAAADREVLEYLQIELADHDVIFAEGAASETLSPSADRKLFDNWQEYEALYGAEPVTEAKAFMSEIYLSGGRAQLRSRLRSAFSP